VKEKGLTGIGGQQLRGVQLRLPNYVVLAPRVAELVRGSGDSVIGQLRFNRIARLMC
jgi:hypothetical protein